MLSEEEAAGSEAPDTDRPVAGERRSDEKGLREEVAKSGDPSEWPGFVLSGPHL